MKKHLLLFFAPFIFFSLSAQITQKEADIKVTEHLSGITIPFTLYAHEDVQTGFEVLTSTGEKLKLAYSCWVYYVNFTEETNGKYLIVKESNGNILEANVKNDEGPEDLEEWRIVVIYPVEIPIEEYSLSETMCVWKKGFSSDITVFNSMEEIEDYISCADGDFPEIDFSEYSLLFISLRTSIFDVGSITFTQFSKNKYKMNVEILRYKWIEGGEATTCTDSRIFAYLTKKLDEESKVELIRNYVSTSIQLKNIDFPYEGNLIVINSMEEFENYFEYPESTTPYIDFSNHTLLLPNGFRHYIEYLIDCQFIKIEENEYELYVKTGGTSTAPGAWILRLLITKLSPDTVISLNYNSMSN